MSSGRTSIFTATRHGVRRACDCLRWWCVHSVIMVSTDFGGCGGFGGGGSGVAIVGGGRVGCSGGGGAAAVVLAAVAPVGGGGDGGLGWVGRPPRATSAQPSPTQPSQPNQTRRRTFSVSFRPQRIHVLLELQALLSLIKWSVAGAQAGSPSPPSVRSFARRCTDGQTTHARLTSHVCE